MGKIKNLKIGVNDKVATSEFFGKYNDKIKGIGGTLHLTNEKECDIISKTAWSLSKNTGKPVVIVVRAN